MKRHEEVLIPERRGQQLAEVICDLCKSAIEKPETYSVDSVEVNHRAGKSYPDGSYIDSISFDLCGSCFDNKLVPWLESNGAEPSISNWDD